MDTAIQPSHTDRWWVVEVSRAAAIKRSMHLPIVSGWLLTLNLPAFYLYKCTKYNGRKIKIKKKNFRPSIQSTTPTRVRVLLVCYISSELNVSYMRHTTHTTHMLSF